MTRLVIFDVDGTLLDSQAMICAAMDRAFADEGMAPPARAATLGIVGLSLPQAMAALAPALSPLRQAALVAGYKAAWHALRRNGTEAEPAFYPGALAALERLANRGWVLGIATGKARRGLDAMLGAHGLHDLFAVTQTADDAPSKPHPQMVLTCLARTGIAPGNAAVLGDTEFDMAMARSAGVRALGAAWGYHPPERLRRGGAEALLKDFGALDGALERLLPPTASSAVPAP